MKNHWLDKSKTTERKIEKMLGCNVIWLEDSSVGRDVESVATWDFETEIRKICEEVSANLEAIIKLIEPCDDPTIVENAMRLSKLIKMEPSQSELERIEAEGWNLDL